MTTADIPAGEAKIALAALTAIVERVLNRARSMPQQPQSAALITRLSTLTSKHTELASADLEIWRRQLAVASRSGTLSALTRDQLRYAPALLWNGEPMAARLPGVLPIVIDHARGSFRALERLARAYLIDYNPAAPGIGEAAACIRGALGETRDLRAEAWKLAQSEVRLFDPARAPATLAERLLEMDEPRIALARYRLDEPVLAAGNYLRAVEDVVLEKAPARLRDDGRPAMDRILKIVAPDGTLRFPERAALAARSLLRAWLTGRGEPSPALQEPIRRQVIEWFGDPRLRRQAWNDEVGGKETALVLGWLARASLDLFFRLIDQQGADPQWRYRRSFWFACLENDLINDSWLALGSEAFNSALAVEALGGAYGRLLGERRQSALLLQIGPLVLGEFTHIGKVRAWAAGSPVAPSLGVTYPPKGYRKEQLMVPGLSFPPNPWRGKGGASDGKGLSHILSHEGYWQGSAAALIEQHIGVRLRPVDWMPR